MSYNVAPILFEAVDAVTATASTELGSQRTVGNKKYVYIYNGGSATASVGSPMSVLTAAAGCNTCTVSTTANHVVKGLVIASIPAASYGWLITEGAVTISCGSGSSSLVLGPQQCGLDGVVKTLVAGGFCIGNLNTAVTSGNTGLLWAKI